MISHAIGQAIAVGMEEFDLLRGDEAYKYTWGAEETRNYQLSFSSAELASKVNRISEASA